MTRTRTRTRTPIPTGGVPRHAEVNLNAFFPFEYAERIKRIATWEDRTTSETLRTLTFLGLSVYDRLAVGMGAKIPPDCPTPSPSPANFVGTEFGKRIFDLEAIRLIERQRRLDVDFQRLKRLERKEDIRRSKRAPLKYGPLEEEPEEHGQTVTE